MLFGHSQSIRRNQELTDVFSGPEMQSLKNFPQKLGRILVDSDSDESEISSKIN
ncbi:hypothetical protein MTR_3g091015 [Medicago truncatula]|uniref:Uncharacterized protein n=1 Tax=Medicago truncatula TaxID=3880 RepID=A0A072V188_MEDTR|nr:hypothetical protein MTR_3g091015 [Medicago truncatula]